MRYSTPASVLATAALLALPVVASADTASGTPSLASPLAPCYSAKIDRFNIGSLDRNAPFGPLTISGPPGTDRWNVEAVDSSGGDLNYRFVTFGAEGRASLPDPGTMPVDAGLGGPGRPVTLTITDIDVRDSPTITLGTTKAAALGVQVVIPTGVRHSSPYLSPRPVVVSGVQFANKTLYGFVVTYPFKPGKFTNYDPARRTSKTLRRIKLGTTDACGYLKKTVTLLRPKDKNPNELYVNAGPKLDKARAVWTHL